MFRCVIVGMKGSSRLDDGRRVVLLTRLIQTTILKLHRAGGRGGAPHPPATEGPHWGMGGVRTDGAAEGQDPPLQQD